MIKHVYQGQEYVYYTAKEASELDIVPVDNWRSAHTGDWVSTSDNFVVPVVHCGEAGKGNYRWIRIPTGTFLCSPGTKLTSELRDNVYTFTGKNTNYKDPSRRLTYIERELVNVYTKTWDPIRSYAQVAQKDPSDPKAQQRARHYLRRANVQKAISMRIRELLALHGITDDYVVQKMKDLETATDNDNVRLKVLENFCKMLDLLDKKQDNTPQMILGVKTTEIYELDRSREEAIASLGREIDSESSDTGAGEAGPDSPGTDTRDVSGYGEVREADASEVDK